MNAMKTKAIDNVKLGFFVLAGVLFLILTLYMIGRNRNLFGNTFTIKAAMTTVNGLMPGNNVRFRGIDVGTVKDIALNPDGAVVVTMIIDAKYRPFIKTNSVASIGTDGLMGNRLVNINAPATDAPPVEEGTMILVREPIETDEMLRTLNTTNSTIERVTRNLDEITVKINSSNSLWNLISDTTITRDLKLAVREFRHASENTAALTFKADRIVDRFENGQGLAGALFTDTTLTARLEYSMNEIQLASQRVSLMMDNLEAVVTGLKAGEGTAGLLLSDTTLRNALMESALQVEEGTRRFNENMEALRTNFLFRKYFRKLEKQEQKSNKDSL
jgi:phospholipid/cholesterol/gamma-HCH transport system substrate-binding protein